MRARNEIHQSLITTDIQDVASVGQSEGLQWKAKKGKPRCHIIYFFSYNIQFP